MESLKTKAVGGTSVWPADGGHLRVEPDGLHFVPIRWGIQFFPCRENIVSPPTYLDRRLNV
jgi:hypothetical protein